MNPETIEEFVMEKMPDHEGSRSSITETSPDGRIEVAYSRNYSPKWGFGGWAAIRVTVDGVNITPSPEWCNRV